MTAKQKTCPLCKHTLEDNLHGFDQNDAWMEGEKLVHSGSCTYCKFCNPVFSEALAKAEKK